MTRLRVSSRLCILAIIVSLLGCSNSGDTKRITPKENNSNGNVERISAEEPPKHAGQTVEITFRGTDQTEWTPPRDPKEYIGSAILVLEDNRFPLNTSGKEILGQVFKIVSVDKRGPKFDRPFPDVGKPQDRLVTLKCKIVPADTVGKTPVATAPREPVESVEVGKLRGTWEGSGAADVSSMSITFGDDLKCKIVYKIGNTTHTVDVGSSLWTGLGDGRLGLGGLGGIDLNLQLQYISKDDSLRISGTFKSNDKVYQLKTAELVRPGKKNIVWEGSNTGVAVGNPNPNPNPNPNVDPNPNVIPAAFAGVWEAPAGTPGFKQFHLNFKAPVVEYRYETAEGAAFASQIVTDGFKQGANKRQWVFQEFKDGALERDMILELSENGKIFSVTGQVSPQLRVRELPLTRPEKKD